MQDDKIDQYKKDLEENIFTCKELTGSSYLEIMSMPVERFYRLIKWKSSLEKDKQRIMDDKMKG